MGKFSDMLNSPEMEEFRKNMKESQDLYKIDVDQFWDNLSYDEQLKAFFFVTSKIYESDVIERGSYRYCIYEKFGFEPDAYILGLDCNYLSLHNIIHYGCDYSEFKSAKKVIIKTVGGEAEFEFSDSRQLNFDFDEKSNTLTIKKEEHFNF